MLCWVSPCNDVNGTKTYMKKGLLLVSGRTGIGVKPERDEQGLQQWSVD